MSEYDRILLTTRHAELEALVRRQRDWREARKAETRHRGASTRSLLRTVRGLRLSARRALKGPRNLI